ncbi:MAG: hypothetical protein J6Y19_10060 [Kiritimatiellae bacterium]|nr:hypothetical protein [Kiritimatiellia bacterium]
MTLSAVFETIMLVCFAAGWPFSIAKALRTRVVAGKSPVFLFVVEIGYLAGILFKLTGTTDAVLFLYVFNFLLVAVDLALYFRFRPRP